ncbi:hypothetical protein FVF58_09290 [Paraburkholderia panacisoli]|uniref:Uncharacterized protein n=1 Tax=Paraburkholderia panacisoli TaxID=2603818 RepID=A0A5B0HD67_9BURK|nr:hypothetical protein [Paraburkholderia panacisoli]KAA1012978.1 hypothetical protein FVF58_09290 [Paraburkholderia panacisoli]
MKREWTFRVKCSHPDCKEWDIFRYDTQRDMVNSFEVKHYSGDRWKCLRHKEPNRVLSASNPETRFEVVSDQKEHGRFFGNSGLVTGPGFLAYAEDLPAGAKLIITARIELPPEPGRDTKTIDMFAEAK